MKKIIWISVSYLLCTFMSSASADTITYESLYGTGEDLYYSYNNVDSNSILLGEFQMSADPANIFVYGYCIEPWQEIWMEGVYTYTDDNSNTYYFDGIYQYDLIDLSSVNHDDYKIYEAVWLLNTWSSDAGASGTGTETEKKQKASALQLAVWKTLLGDEFEYVTDSSDNDSFTGTNSYYNHYINSLTNYDKTEIENKGFRVADLYLLDSDGTRIDTQNIIVRVVPEPTTMLLFGIGLLGLGAIGRKRRI